MVMGVLDWGILEESTIPDSIIALAQARTEAKKNKDYARADEIRKEIEWLGYVITDSKDGTILEKR